MRFFPELFARIVGPLQLSNQCKLIATLIIFLWLLNPGAIKQTEKYVRKERLFWLKFMQGNWMVDHQFHQDAYQLECQQSRFISYSELLLSTVIKRLSYKKFITIKVILK